jgi:hypothetical protein
MTRALPRSEDGPKQGGCSPPHTSNPVNIPHDVENRGVATRFDQELNPQISGPSRVPLQVTESARLNLSRWRLGFEPRWDYKQEPRSGVDSWRGPRAGGSRAARSRSGTRLRHPRASEKRLQACWRDRRPTLGLPLDLPAETHGQECCPHSPRVETHQGYERHGVVRAFVVAGAELSK